MDYRQWKEEGWIRVTNGNVIDIDEMVADLTRILRRYDVQSLAFDPAKAYHGVIQGLQKGDSTTCSTSSRKASRT